MPHAVILTALPIEYLAVRAHLTDLQEEMHPQGTIYERGKFVANGQMWEVGIAEVGAGNAGAAVEAERAIAHFKPHILFFVGIAGGIKDVAIGDVVAATKVYSYESGKVGDHFFTRPALGQSTYALVQRAKSEARKAEWRQRLPSSPVLQPRVFVAPIAAGEKVVASKQSDIFQFLRASYNDAIAVEMEGFGFLNAAFAYPNIKAIVIRGISDLIEGKNDDFVEPEEVRQEKASCHASAFAFEILAKYQIKHKRKQISPSNPPSPSPDPTNPNEELNLSDLSEVARKFSQAPENITDPTWKDWFYEMFELQFKILQEISFKVGKLLKAHRTTVYFIGESEKDKNQKELWSIFAQGDASLEIRILFGEGISGRVAESKQVSLVPYDAHKHINSEEIKKQDSRTGYRTYTLMTLPLLNNRGELVAVFQFLNKLSGANLNDLISAEATVTENNIDKNGFTKEDQNRFGKYVTEIRSTLDLYQHYYNLAKKWQSIVNFSNATLTLNKEGQDLENLLKIIINEAQNITNADRGTFWLLDRKGETLQARILDQNDSYRMIEIKVGEGFAGKVAKSKSELNIPYDLYDHPDSAIARKTDQNTGYRTYSLLCMPVFNSNDELIGVTQLINKRRRQSKYQEYRSEDYLDGKIPEFFKASFSTEDEERLRKFNEQVAAAIQNAQRSVMVEQYNNLYNLLNIMAQLAGGYLNAHRARIFLVDEETKFGKDKNPKELWSIVSRGEHEEPFEISVPIGSEEYVDLPGQVAKEYIDCPQDFAKDEIFRNEEYSGDQLLIDPYLQASTEQNQNANYVIYSRLLLPISKTPKESNSLIAVLVFINKLKPGGSQDYNLSENILDKKGFTKDDKEIFMYGHAASLTRLIDAFLDVYKPVRQYLDAEKLIRAREFLFQESLGDIKVIEEKVKKAARQIVNAHRCTLWRVDPKDKNILFANIPNDKGGSNRIEVTIGDGYVGDAAQRAINAIKARKSEEKKLNSNVQDQDEKTGSFLNIIFDVYKDKRSHIAKRTDINTGYRTCSILCIPILSSEGNELLGIVQLINKVRRGFEDIASTADSLFGNKQTPPNYFMASFTKKDERQIASFNDAVGDILQFLGAPAEISQWTEAYLKKISAAKNPD